MRCVSSASPLLRSGSVCTHGQESGGSSTEAGREGERREKEDPSDRALSSSSSRRGLKGSASRDEGPRNRAPRLIGDTTDMADGAGQGFWRAGERCGGAVYCSRAVGGCHKGPERDQTRLQKPDHALRTTVEMKRLRFWIENLLILWLSVINNSNNIIH